MDTTGAVVLSDLTGVGLRPAPNGSVPHIRTSERKDFKRCQQRWAWAWRQGLRPRIEKPGALWFGIGMHLVLQHRYQYRGLKRGGNLLREWRNYVGDTKAIIYADEYADTGEFWDGAALGEEMIGNYLDTYGKDERWFVLSAEQTFDLPIPYPRRSPRAGQHMATYNGTFDLVALDQEGNDSLWLWDHKNVKQFIDLATLSMDDQAGSYWAVAGDVLAARGLVEKGMKLDGILYNQLRKGKKDDRPVGPDGLAHNKPQKQHYIDAGVGDAKMKLDDLAAEAEERGIEVFGDVSARQPTPLFHRDVVWRTSSERRTQIRRIQDEALQMEAFRERLLPLTKNPTKECKWDCAFFEMCQLHEAGDDYREFKRASFVKRDPYADHR